MIDEAQMRERLMGKELGKNDWGDMTYEVGLIEKNLEKEYDFHSVYGEGYFLASLCLYFLSNKNDISHFFPYETDRIFLENFVFYHIPQELFLNKINNLSNEDQKVSTICKLIKEKFCSQYRFCDFYTYSYKCIGSDEKINPIQYCHNVLEFSKTHPIPFEYEEVCNFKGSEVPDDSVPISHDKPSELVSNITPKEENTPSSNSDKFQTNPLDIRINLNILLSNYLEERKNKVDPKTGKIQDYYHKTLFTFFPFIQKSFKQKEQAVLSLQAALNNKDELFSGDLKQHLATLRNGTLGKQLREFIKKTDTSSLINKNVNTVSEFINALDATLPPRPKNEPK